jgi:hypothetical protein
VALIIVFPLVSPVSPICFIVFIIVEFVPVLSAQIELAVTVGYGVYGGLTANPAR